MPLSERLSSKFHSCPRNNCSLFGQSFSVGHYPPIYQPTKGVYLLNTFRKLKGIIFINTVLFYNILRVWGSALRARAPLTVNQRKSGRWILNVKLNINHFHQLWCITVLKLNIVVRTDPIKWKVCKKRPQEGFQCCLN